MSKQRLAGAGYCADAKEVRYNINQILHYIKESSGSKNYTKGLG